MVVKRFANAADDEIISSRGGGGAVGDDGCNGDVVGVLNRSDNPIKIFDMNVVRNLGQNTARDSITLVPIRLTKI
jgi:hypothetical protein